MPKPNPKGRNQKRKPNKPRNDLSDIFNADPPKRPKPKAQKAKPEPVKAPAPEPVFTLSPKFEILAICAPGLENALCDEITSLGFSKPSPITGGAQFEGTWQDVWRANLSMRGAARILARLGSFPAAHLAQLDKRAMRVPWGDIIPQGTTLRVEASCHKSKIYHQKATAERIETALKETIQAQIDPDATLCVKIRIDNDICTISIDTSGEALHKRGLKLAVGKAPMRENMAALILRACDYTPGMAIVDPMCGSGTFVIEAAEITAGLLPGRARSFALQELLNYDERKFSTLNQVENSNQPNPVFFGSDRDLGAINASHKNATRAGVDHLCDFKAASISDLKRPDTDAGLVIINPPYGLRIGERRPLFALYGTIGKTLLSRFQGWRVAIVCPDAGLIKATGLPFKPNPQTIMHGGIRLGLYQTDSLLSKV